MKTFHTKLSLALFLATHLMPMAEAATVQWGGVISSTVLLSDGTVVDEVSTPALNITFALGSFDSGFTPSASNLGDWSSNWRTIAETPFSLDTQYFAQETVLVDSDTGVAGIQFNGNTFTPGEAVYIWGYNQQVVGESMEWVLMSGRSGADTNNMVVDPTNTNWEIPDLVTTDQGVFPLNWRTTTATHSLFGTTDGDVGGGEISAPGTGSENLQFATVPEPATWLYGLLASLGWLGFYRRRS